MSLRTVDDVIARLRAIDGELPYGDGAAVFNRMYLTVTERVAGMLATGSTFRDGAFMHDLDVAFAALWVDAYDAVGRGEDVPKAWAPLFEHRTDARVLPVQFALAGMNAHIEHDLPVALVQTCAARGRSLDEADVRADYEAVNAVLASVESEVRRSFLTEVGQVVDDRVGAVVHLVSAWNIDKARDLAWVSAETLWCLRETRLLVRRFRSALARTVGMTSRCLLTPCLP